MDHEDLARRWMPRLAYGVPAVQLGIGGLQALAYGLGSAPSWRWVGAFALSCVVAHQYCYYRGLGKTAALPGPLIVDPESDERKKTLADATACALLVMMTVGMIADRPAQAFWHSFE